MSISTTQDGTRSSSWYFPLLLSVFFIICRIIIVTSLLAGTPTGTRSLGATIHSTNDNAAYHSYIAQVQAKGPRFSNLYAVEPNTPRMDPVWSSLGLISKSGLDPNIVLEIARGIFTFLLLLALHTASRSVTKTERHAQLGTLLALGGFLSGWLLFPFMGIHNPVAEMLPELPPEMSSEFSPSYALLSNIHLILSTALLLCALRLSWKAYDESCSRDAIKASACAMFLFLIHPYFLPLFGCYLVTTHVWHLRKNTPAQHRKLFFILAASTIPAALYFASLISDASFRNHHLYVNYLPLGSWRSWLLALLPCLVAYSLRVIKKIPLDPREYWLVAWCASVICCLFLPLPFTRKFLEGSLIALVLLTVPTWTYMIRRRWHGLLLIGFSFIGFYFLFGRDLAIPRLPQMQRYLYQPLGVFQAWQFISTHTDPSAVLLSNDGIVNVWTPTYTMRRIWIGHNHETPDYQRKFLFWKELISSPTTSTVDTLTQLPITHLLLTQSSTTTHMLEPILLEKKWIKLYDQAEVHIWKKE